MQSNIKNLSNLIWVNIVNPEIIGVKKIMVENGMNETLANEIVNPTLRAKVDTLRNAIYLTFHLPIKRNDITEIEELDILIKNNLIVTSQYKEIPFVKDYIDKLQNKENYHGGNYFIDFIKEIYSNIESTLIKNSEDIKFIEQNIFSGDERRTIENIASVSKRIIDIKSALNLHKDVIEYFKQESTKIFGFEFTVFGEVLKNEYDELVNILENQNIFIDQLKSTTDFLLSNKTNQLVKVFTVVSFIILPMSFLASFFGMNTKFPNDLVTSPYGTVYILFIMFVVSILTLVYLHYKKLI